MIQDFSLLFQIDFCCCFFAWSVSELYAIGFVFDILIDVLHQVIEVVTVWSALNLSMVIKSCWLYFYQVDWTRFLLHPPHLPCN